MPTNKEAPPAPAIPEPSDYVVRAVADWLHAKGESQRVPVKTATVLALVCLLYREQRPFPTRPAIAKQLNLTESVVDMALSQQTANGLLFQIIKTEMGRVRKRPSVVHRRYVEPSPELWQFFQKTEKAEKKEQSRMAWRRKTLPLIALTATLSHFCPHCWGLLMEIMCPLDTLL